MGLLDWLNAGDSNRYFDQVEAKMRKSIKVPENILLRLRTQKARANVEKSRLAGESPDTVALRLSANLYVLLLSGSQDERKLANRLYIPLKFFIGAAQIDKSISSEEASFYEAIIAKAAREAILKDGIESGS